MAEGKNRETTIIVTENVNEYRATIPECVKQDDTVLEVGCAEVIKILQGRNRD